MDAMSVIRTHDPSICADEDSSCIRTRGHKDYYRSMLPKEKRKEADPSGREF
jgi:hypothetical protein